MTGLFLTFTRRVFEPMRLTPGSRPRRARVTRRAAHQRLTMRVAVAKINARPARKPRRFGDVVDRKAVHCKPMRFLIFAWWRARALGSRARHDETNASTSMFKRMTLAFLASVSCLGLRQANAIEAAATPERVIPPINRRSDAATASAERSNAGRRLHRIPVQRRTDVSSNAYQQQPSYQPQPTLLPQQEEAEYERRRSIRD